MMLRSLPHSLAFFKKQGPEAVAARGDFPAWWNGQRRRRDAADLPRPLQLPDGGSSSITWPHAASAYYCSPWEDALVLSLDGTGEWTTTLLARGRGNSIEKLRQSHILIRSGPLRRRHAIPGLPDLSG